jgi:hypothetical protein
MNEDQIDKAGRRRTRIFLVIFVGLALALSVTTIVRTWSRMGEQATVSAPASP